jgi:hypothetical protein
VRFTRPTRLRLTVVALLALLLAQWSAAAYACPALGMRAPAGAAIVAAVHDCAGVPA